MFLVCDKIMHLCRLCFSWPYNQENDTLPIDFLGGKDFLVHRQDFVFVITGKENSEKNTIT